MKDFETEHQPLFVQASIPYEVLKEAGIDFELGVQFHAYDGKIVIEQIVPATEPFSCIGDCDTCPMLFRCSGECETCPCLSFCEKSFDPQLCIEENSSLLNLLDNLSEKAQYAALIHLTARWAERNGGFSNV